MRCNWPPDEWPSGSIQHPEFSIFTSLLLFSKGKQGAWDWWELKTPRGHQVGKDCSITQGSDSTLLYIMIVFAAGTLVFSEALKYEWQLPILLHMYQKVTLRHNLVHSFVWVLRTCVCLCFPCLGKQYSLGKHGCCQTWRFSKIYWDISFSDDPGFSTFCSNMCHNMCDFMELFLLHPSFYSKHLVQWWTLLAYSLWYAIFCAMWGSG